MKFITSFTYHQTKFLTLGMFLTCVFTNANAINSNPAQYLAENFEPLPEQQMSMSSNGDTYAFYAQPTAKYSHGILGDDIEAEKLVVWHNGTTYTYSLGNEYVFEDIKPRLYDVDNDGQMEVVTIRTQVSKGAGVMIYKIADNALIEFAWVDEIGTPNRWLNIVAVYDLDGNGSTELAWIQTPHIGGILKVATIRAGKLQPTAEIAHYSNHSIGERNLCLSVVTHSENSTNFYVPTQDRTQIVGFNFIGGAIQRTETIEHPVNFSEPLLTQYRFSNVVQGSGFCLE
jgi:hypothetical protein